MIHVVDAGRCKFDDDTLRLNFVAQNVFVDVSIIIAVFTYGLCLFVTVAGVVGCGVYVVFYVGAVVVVAAAAVVVVVAAATVVVAAAAAVVVADAAVIIAVVSVVVVVVTAANQLHVAASLTFFVHLKIMT